LERKHYSVIKKLLCGKGIKQLGELEWKSISINIVKAGKQLDIVK